MTNSETKKLSRKQVSKLLKDFECIRVSSLDIGGIFESYQLPDGRILVDFAGEGGTIYESRGELEGWLRESQSRQSEFEATLPQSYTVFFDQPLDSPLEALGQLGFVEPFHHVSYTVEPFHRISDVASSLEELDSLEEFELSLSDKSYVTSFVRYFQPLGFYQVYKNLSESELVEKLAEFWATEGGFPFDSANSYIDLFLLQWDFERVWWQDVEADVCMGNEVYAASVERWAKISRSVFLAENVTESWVSPQEVQVHLTVNKQNYCLYPQVNSDWLDLDILGQINALIQGSGYQFEIVQTGMQIAFVTVLTSTEKQQLQSERNWVFLTL